MNIPPAAGTGSAFGEGLEIPGFDGIQTSNPEKSVPCFRNRTGQEAPEPSVVPSGATEGGASFDEPSRRVLSKRLPLRSSTPRRKFENPFRRAV